DLSVHFANVYALVHPGRQRRYRLVELQRDAERPREAIHGAERQDAEHVLGPRQYPGCDAQSPVATTDDDQRRFTAELGLDEVADPAGFHEMRGDLAMGGAQHLLQLG